MNFRVHRYRSADDRLDLYARDYPGDGPALLMMHGLTRNSADFAPLAARLAGRYRLIVPDQRGRGLSQYDPDTRNYRPDVYAADMLALVDGLGVQNPGLVGTSMGGLMAMVMGFMRPGAFPAMVFNDVGPVLDPAGIARIQSYVGPSGPMANWDEAAARCRGTNEAAFPDYGDEEWRAFAHRTCRVRQDGLIELAYDPAIAESIAGDDPQTVPPDLWPLWENLSPIPVLVVRGALSDLLSPRTVQEMEKRHEGPFRSVEVSRVGHAPMLDEPEALTAIEAFLRDHL